MNILKVAEFFFSDLEHIVYIQPVNLGNDFEGSKKFMIYFMLNGNKSQTVCKISRCYCMCKRFV